jgi:hypothetical protein
VLHLDLLSATPGLTSTPLGKLALPIHTNTFILPA